MLFLNKTQLPFTYETLSNLDIFKTLQFFLHQYFFGNTLSLEKALLSLKIAHVKGTILQKNCDLKKIVPPFTSTSYLTTLSSENVILYVCLCNF